MVPGKNEPEDSPRSLRNPAVRAQRIAMLQQPHIAPLTAYAAKLRSRNMGEVPDFDPLDGGIEARILFLFEKPGQMTSSSEGSGFIRRNNDDPTAEATFEFMRRARIPRKWTLTWNVIPWWNGTRKITGGELREGIGYLQELISLLPNLHALVLVGKRAAKAIDLLRENDLALLVSAHPSPLVRARYPERWNAIPSEWERAMSLLAEDFPPQ